MVKICLLIPALIFALTPLKINQEKADNQANTVFSEDGRYRATFDFGPGNAEYLPLGHFTLYRDGAVVYSRNDFGHTLADISNTGSVVGIDFRGPIGGPTGLSFYDDQGRKIGTASIEFLHERTFSRNGSVYCVNDGIAGVRVFDARGGELYNLGKANYCAVAPAGDLIALGRDDAIVLYRNGQSVDRFPVQSPLIRQMVFSDDGSLLAFACRDELIVYRVRDRHQLLAFAIFKKECEFISLDIAPDNSLFLAGCDEDFGRGSDMRHKRGYVLLLDSGGNLIWQHPLDYDQWNISSPGVRFTSDNTFRVMTVTDNYDFRF